MSLLNASKHLALCTAALAAIGIDFDKLKATEGALEKTLKDLKSKADDGVALSAEATHELTAAEEKNTALTTQLNASKQEISTLKEAATQASKKIEYLDRLTSALTSAKISVTDAMKPEEIASALATAIGAKASNQLAAAGLPTGQAPAPSVSDNPAKTSAPKAEGLEAVAEIYRTTLGLK